MNKSYEKDTANRKYVPYGLHISHYDVAVFFFDLGLCKNNTRS